MERDDSNITRRTLLKGGLAAAAAGLTLPAAASARAAPKEDFAESSAPAESAESVMPALANYMKEAQSRPLPDEAAEHTRLHVLDTIAAMVSGSTLPPGRAAHNFARDYGSGGSATVVG